ncbi:lysozyme inhibitor LprI family protein [Massilia suwonensis]|uniref:Lysozyme inhibitor LprI family protein n=1 Tax=Massilia suwonensis TaxID=648895 RepID=A0ABW0MSN6_9BURK
MRRPHVLRSAVLAVLLVWAGAAHASPQAAAYPNTEGFGIDFEKSEDWYAHCVRALHAAPPPAPAPAKMRCNASDLYYLKRDQDSTSNAEWREVRDCAEATGDDAVLMMLYANGYGVARNPDRAIYHACKLDSAKAEMELRVGYLASPAAAADRQPFDLCDHITSGRMGGVCAAISQNRAEHVRAAHLDRFAASLPSAVRQPFARLRAAAAAFTRKAAGEVDMTGTGGAGFTFRHSGRRAEEFLDTLLKAASGKLPPASPARLAQLDRELNEVYQKVLATPSEQENHPERIRSSTVKRAAVRDAQRAWLAYRDAWEPFLAAARLPVDAAAVKAVLTRQRVAQLKRI